MTETIRCAQAHVSNASISVSDFSNFPLLAHYAKALRLRRIRCHLSWDWNHNTAWLGTDSRAFLDCVRRKTTKKYDAHGIRELWLLIVSGPHLSQAMGLDLHLVLPQITEAEALLGRSAFAKAYVLQYMFDVAYEWPGWRKIGEENFRNRHAQQAGGTLRR